MQRYSSEEMIEALVGFDTTSSRSNLELIDFVESYLGDLGVSCRRTANAEGNKANLYATLGPETAGGVVLSGHSDVVPVTGQDWHSDPFQVLRRDGRLYGRGTADMKSFLAVALALAPEFLEAGLQRPIHLALSYDEEVGCLGVGGLIADIAENLPRPAIVIVGEPTSMQPVVEHKGISVFRTTVTGKAAHSSQPHRGANAILAAGELIAELGRIAEDLRQAAPGESPYDPPYTTVGIGRIKGGEAVNIVAEHCSFEWEFRNLPQQDPAEIEARFRAYAEGQVLPKLCRNVAEARIETESLSSVGAFRRVEDSDAERLVRRLTGSNRREAVSFGTESSLFQEAGISTVVCGPGSIDQAHQADEFIEISQVEDCAAMLRKLKDWAAGKA
ncbi:MAG: acetylornithine deacetylase [Rhodovibrionaceae bacterium]